MDAKKCDVCGAFFEEDNSDSEDEPRYEVYKFLSGKEQELDLCSACHDRVSDALTSKAKKERKKSSWNPAKLAAHKMRLIAVQDTARAIKKTKNVSHSEALRLAHKEVMKNRRKGLCEMCGVKKPEDGEYVCRSCSGTLSV